jgi:hypothetical protein
MKTTLPFFSGAMFGGCDGMYDQVEAEMQLKAKTTCDKLAALTPAVQSLGLGPCEYQYIHQASFRHLGDRKSTTNHCSMILSRSKH